MKIKNKTISETFKKAKSVLNQMQFICTSLQVFEPLGTTRASVRVCKRIVKDRMLNYITLESYLNNQHNIDLVINPNWVEEMLNYRHRWLDSLIEEFDIDGYYEG